MVVTLSGLSLSAVFHVEEEHNYLQEPAPILRQLTVEKTAVSWAQIKRKFHVMKENAVSILTVTLSVLWLERFN